MPTLKSTRNVTVEDFMEELIDEWVCPDGKLDPDTPEKITSMIMVFCAQGIIDNGGFEYFFSSDFPGAKAGDFVRAYRSLGLNEHASKLEGLLGLFPGGEPQEDLDTRKSFLEERFGWDYSDVREVTSFFFKESEKVYCLIWSLAYSLKEKSTVH